SQLPESPVTDPTFERRRGRERVQLSRLVVELELPQKLEARLPLQVLHRLLRNLRVPPDPGRTLRVSIARHPVHAALGFRLARPGDEESDTDDECASKSSHQETPFTFCQLCGL